MASSLKARNGVSLMKSVSVLSPQLPLSRLSPAKPKFSLHEAKSPKTSRQYGRPLKEIKQPKTHLLQAPKIDPKVESQKN